MKKLIVPLLLLVIVLNASAQEPASFPAYIEKAADHQEINGNVLIAQQGTVVYKRSLGYADIAEKKSLTDDTQFPLASISKTFTSTAVLQLKDAGMINISEPLVKYLVQFPYPNITIRQVLSHTSGLPDTDELLDSLVAATPTKIFTNQDIIPALQWYSKHKSLKFQPGERWGYSSVGYSLLAMLVEKISGMPFGNYLQQNIFLPAGMTGSYLQTSLDQTKGRYRTKNYIYNNHYQMKLQFVDTLADRREWTYNQTGTYGGNNIVATATDLLKYDEALYNGKLLKPATLQEAFTPVKLNNGQDNQAIAGTSMGLGWFIFTDTTAGKIVWHSGSNPGVTTLFARNITTHETYVVLLNLALSNPVYQDLLSLVKHKPVIYKQPLGFIYARELFKDGPDYALAHLQSLKADTTNYVLTKADMDRAALEFSRDRKLQDQTLETHRVNLLLFPNDWQVWDNYAAFMLNRMHNNDAALMLYKGSLRLNPLNEAAKKMIEQIGLSYPK